MNLSQPFFIDKRHNEFEICLNGKWSFTSKDIPTDTPDKIYFDMDCTLPASTFINLYENKILPDPYYGINSKQYSWVDTKVWYYKRSFTLDRAPISDKEDAFLCFEGIGYYSRVWLNGVSLGEHEGMFGGPIINVADKLVCGENTIIVEVKAFNYDKEGDIRLWHGYEPIGWRNKIPEIIPWNLARDAEHNSGDFHMFGIWRDIRLQILPKMHLSRPYLATESIDGDSATMDFEVSIATEKLDELSCIISSPEWNYTFSYREGLSGALSDEIVNIQIELTDPDNCKTVYCEAEDYILNDYEKNGIAEKFRNCHFYKKKIYLNNIELWYPNGLGNPKLYDVKITLKRDDILLDTLEFKTGIRTVEQFESAGRKYRQRWDKFWFCVNGKKIFLKGMNWTPMDFLFKNSYEDYLWALEQAKACGIQLLRVWSGGNMPEEDVFYELCDKFGIMVWQDAPIANQETKNWSPVILENQWCYNIFRIRNHPCLSVYCGGNEFSPYALGNNASMFVIQRNIEDLDPTKIFFRTTPDRGSYHFYRNLDPAWNRKMFKELPFMGESGTASFPNYKNICKFLNKNEQTDKIDMLSDDFESSFPGLINRLAGYKANKCNELRCRASRYIDIGNSNLKDYCEGTQMAASEYYTFLIQSLRENYPKSVGVMPWAYKRNWSAISVQVLDGAGEATAPYYAVKNAYRQKLGFAALENVIYAPEEESSVDIKVINDASDDFCGTVIAEIFDNNLNKISVKTCDLSVTTEEYMKTAFALDFKTDKSWTNSHFYIRVSLLENGILTPTSLYPLFVTDKFNDKAVMREYRENHIDNFLFENIKPVKSQIGITSAKISAEILEKHRDGNRTYFKVALSTDFPAYPVMIEATQENAVIQLSDNCFFLDKGEDKVVDIVVRNDDIENTDVSLTIHSWNCDSFVIS